MKTKLRSNRILVCVLIFVLALCLVSCGGGSSNPQAPVLNPVPSISAIIPANMLAGGSSFTLVVDGSNFISTSVVRWNGLDRATTFQSSVRVTAQISGSDIANAGTITVTVLNPTPGGGFSNAATFTITNSIPTITTLTPASATAGGAFTLAVDGSNFVSSSLVRWNGTNRVTTFVSSTRLTAAILASDTALAGTANVTVLNPTPGGGTSNSVAITINNPMPSISTLNPSSVIAGNATFPLTVDGAGFASGSTVQWNGSARPTTFVSATQLTASIPAADVATAGLASVTVFNPAPGGGVSSAMTFTINPFTSNPVPVISSLSDTSASAGWPGFVLTVTGSSFVAASTVQWNGLNHTTTVLSSTQLSVAIPAADLAAAGAAQVQVFNASPGGGTSNVLDFTIKSVASNAVGVMERASTAADLSSGNNSSGAPAISATGRYVAFDSFANNLVPGDTNNFSDVFLRDTCLGAPAGCTPSVIRVSVSALGAEGNSDSFRPTISGDGRFVTFYSAATNLVPGDTNSVEDILLRDTCIGAAAGCTPAISRISVATSGTQANGGSFWPNLSADGRFIAFESDATNLVSSDTNNSRDIFLRDTCFGAAAGCTPQTIRISQADNGSQANNGSFSASVSADGRFVAFESAADNLVASDTNTFVDIFMRDTCFGAPAGCTPSTVRVSVNTSGAQATLPSFLAAISSTGRFIVFTSFAANLVTGDTNNGHDVFLRDLCFGAPAGCSPSTIRISVASNGSQADAPSGGPATAGASISTDGQLVALGSRATNLVSGDTNGTFDVFVRNTCVGIPAGCTPSTVRLSVALDGAQGDDRSDFPRISADGRFLAFQSAATTLAPGDHGSGSLTKVYVTRTGRP